MKTLILLLLVVLLASCARVNIKVSETEGWDISYNVLWREFEDLEATVGDITFSLGRAGNVETPDNTVIACILAPELCE